MNPKDKAKLLVNLQFIALANVTNLKDVIAFKISKQCALITVHEIILESRGYNSERESYWLSVKQEIEKL